LSTTNKLFAEVILNKIQRHIEERGLLNGSQFDFYASHSMAVQYIRLTDHVTLNFNNNIPTVPVLLDIEESFATIWHFGLLYKLSELKFSVSLIKLTISSSFLSQRNFRISVEGKISTLKDIQTGVPQTPGIFLSPFADIYIYGTDSKEGYVLRKLQRVLSTTET
jgi:hypothetical protein